MITKLPEPAHQGRIRAIPQSQVQKYPVHQFTGKVRPLYMYGMLPSVGSRSLGDPPIESSIAKLVPAGERQPGHHLGGCITLVCVAHGLELRERRQKCILVVLHGRILVVLVLAESGSHQVK